MNYLNNTYYNITYYISIFDDYIKGLSLMVGIFAGLFVIYKWYYDRENQKKATFYTIFVICQDIINIIDHHEKLGENKTRELFAYTCKTLNNLVYNYNGIIYFNRTEDLWVFLSLKKDIEHQSDFFEKRNWIALKDILKDKAFKETKRKAEFLLEICKKEFKSLKEYK